MRFHQHTVRIVGFVGFALLTSVACGKKKNSGNPIGMGQLLIPVKDSAPTGLANSSAASKALVGESFLNDPQTGGALSELKSRLFSPGPTDFMDRLKMVDGRLAELDKRHQESARKCVSDTAKEWKLSGLPDADGGTNATQSFWLQCSEILNSELSVYFGRKDGYSYLIELQKSSGSNPTMAVLGKVDDASTKAEVWTIYITSASQTDESKKHSSWMYVLGDKANKNFEMSVGGSGSMGKDGNGDTPFSGLGCGVKVKANATLVQGIGQFFDANSSLDSAGNCQTASTTVCANAADLSSAADCSAVSSFSASVPKLTYAGLGGATAPRQGYTLGKKIIDGEGIPALTSFNDVAEVK